MKTEEFYVIVRERTTNGIPVKVYYSSYPEGHKSLTVVFALRYISEKFAKADLVNLKEISPEDWSDAYVEKHTHTEERID